MAALHFPCTSSLPNSELSHLLPRVQVSWKACGAGRQAPPAGGPLAGQQPSSSDSSLALFGCEWVPLEDLMQYVSDSAEESPRSPAAAAAAVVDGEDSSEEVDAAALVAAPSREQLVTRARREVADFFMSQVLAWSH